jgi:hypothetical protein
MHWDVARRLMNTPAFTALTVLTLAIGIGANSAIFAVIESVLLKPLPYAHSEELINVDISAPGVNFNRAGSSAFLYFTYRDETHTLENISLWRHDTDSLTGSGEPQEVATLDVTEDFLTALHVQPILGRPFSRNDTTSGNPDTVIASYNFWQSKFGGDPHVIGRNIILNGRTHEIVGVLPQNFEFLDYKPTLVLPIKLDPAKTVLGQFNYQSIARLKPGVSLAESTADVARMIPIALHRFPPFPGLSEKMFEEAHLTPVLESLKQSLLGDIGKVLWVLMGTVGIVLLIASANVMNLLFVRVQGREHELAIRSALGAGRREIAGELLRESLTVCVLGGLVGLALAYAAIRVLVALAPANLPRLGEISIDPATMLFNFCLSIRRSPFRLDPGIETQPFPDQCLAPSRRSKHEPQPRTPSGAKCTGCGADCAGSDAVDQLGAHDPDVSEFAARRSRHLESGSVAGIWNLYSASSCKRTGSGVAHAAADSGQDLYSSRRRVGGHGQFQADDRKQLAGYPLCRGSHLYRRRRSANPPFQGRVTRPFSHAGKQADLRPRFLVERSVRQASCGGGVRESGAGVMARSPGSDRKAGPRIQKRALA